MTDESPEEPDQQSRGPDAEGDPADPEADILVCEVCGGPMIERHCKITCTVCGYQRDCSDP